MGRALPEIRLDVSRRVCVIVSRSLSLRNLRWNYAGGPALGKVVGPNHRNQDEL